MKVLIDNSEIEFDTKSGKMFSNGEHTKDWDPIFCENGDDKDLCGYHNKKTNKTYDLDGKQLQIDNEDLIK